MFTGIVEATGKIKSISEQGSGKILEIECPFTNELKVDQSISHNGTCLTVTEIRGDSYFVTAIAETLRRTNLSLAKPGDMVNLERCLKANARFDGHIVQGHVDCTAECISIKDERDSYLFEFSHEKNPNNLTVEKGSVCVNGVSLTVVDSKDDRFTVAIIPFTFNNTTFRYIKKGSVVNVEFDVIGKYMRRIINYKL